MTIAAIGLRSIMPVLGMMRRNGSQIGSVTRKSTGRAGWIGRSEKTKEGASDHGPDKELDEQEGELGNVWVIGGLRGAAVRREFASNDTKHAERTCEGHDAAAWFTTAIMSQRMMMTAIGLRSIIPIRGMMRRNGSISGSVMRRRT